MSTDVPVPTPLVIPVHCVPKKAPCPTCGQRGRRTRTLTRTVRTVAYKPVAFLKITYGEYHARWGRKGAKSKAAAARRGMTAQEKANFVFRRRHLIVKRRENLTESERDDLIRMLEYLPELATLRRFADRIYWLFDTPKDAQQAGCRRAVIVRDPAFQAVPELAKAMEQLNAEKFPKLMAYLKNPMSRRVRSNNHVERTNRMFRPLEMERYKWRQRRMLVRFVVVTLDAIWRDWTPTKSKTTQHSKPVRQGTAQVHDGRRSRQVA